MDDMWSAWRTQTATSEPEKPSVRRAKFSKSALNCGNLTGSTTASCSACLAPSSPATSFHLTFGFSDTIAEWIPAQSLARSESSPSPPPYLALLRSFPFASVAAGAAAAGAGAAAARREARISSARAM
uniref:Uncharacterized protein n=1 Tax=Leersia perrieri TaxID=77586 RepID=A0A0D9VCG3_9ORYZ